MKIVYLRGLSRPRNKTGWYNHR